MPIEIVNLKKIPADRILPAGASRSIVVYIGRPMPGRPGSPLANPYKLERGQTRSVCLEKYRAWLERELKIGQSPARRELVNLATIARIRHMLLACWCAPEICHGDVIKEEIEKLHVAWAAEEERGVVPRPRPPAAPDPGERS